MPRVFLLEPPRHDLNITTAAVFGDVVYLYEHGGQRPSIFKTTAFVSDVLQKLERLNYDPDVDIFCVSGQFNGVALALCGITHKWKNVKVLLFNSVADNYELRVLDF